MEVIIPEEAFIPHYRQLIYADEDIIFLYGGRDSGKTHFIAQRLIYDCITLPYFRCLLIKKTFNSIRESQYQAIKDVIEFWGFESLFTFTTNPLSIVCHVNGNRFIARGTDDPQSIKSTKDPSHAWYEEGNQLELEDLITVATTLRTNLVKIQQWFSFNPECEGDFEDFWLYKMIFAGRYSLSKPSFSGEWMFGEGDDVESFTFRVLHSTYHNNPYCSPKRKVFLENLKTISPYYYDIYTLGRWGRILNKSPFVWAFDKSIHVGNTVYNHAEDLYISFDFNRDPICASIFQYYDDTIFGIETIKIGDSNIYELCERIMIKYPDAIFRVTGDATGRASNALARDEMNYYKVIRSVMGLASAQLKVPNINPTMRENQILSNAVLVKVKCIFDRDGCDGLIYDFMNVKVLKDGSIDKGDRNDATKQADALDTWRYFCNSFFKWVLKE